MTPLRMVCVDFDPRICSSGDFSAAREVRVVPAVFFSRR